VKKHIFKRKFISTMLKNLFKSKEAAEQKGEPPLNILVIQSDDYDWYELFASKTVNGRPIVVEQVGWEDVMVAGDNYSRNPCVVHLNMPASRNDGKKKYTVKRRFNVIKPDFVLVRNEVRIVGKDYRNQLYGLMYANIPSVNSLKSIYMCCERPIVQAELNKLMRIHGREKFPVVSQGYFSNHNALMYGQSFPAVVKIGFAHAGMGKMKIGHHHDMDDFRTVLAMTDGCYCTGEPFIKGAFDLRIQKIGSKIRVFKRISLSGSWKTNTGSSHLEEIELKDRYRFWIEESSKMFGGMDILTVDVLVEENGTEHILEVNGTSSGLNPECAQEDNETIRDLVLEKLEAIYGQE